MSQHASPVRGSAWAESITGTDAFRLTAAENYSTEGRWEGVFFFLVQPEENFL